MHNKRIGRDDLLKIEVRPRPCFLIFTTDTKFSGLVLHHPRAGASTRAAHHAAATALHVVALGPHLAAATTKIVSVTAVIAGTVQSAAIATVETATGIGTWTVTGTTIVATGATAGIGTALAAQRTVIETVT